MARRRKGRPVNGVILIDKHQGESSNHIVQQVKRLYKAQKAGHTGALDPLATGMLPVCLGEATKFSQYLLDADKTYEVVAKLGERTDTSDADGEIIERNSVNVSLEQIEEALEQFRGEIQQTPSIYSALKYQGKPLYYYARSGIEVPRPTRTINVYNIEILALEGDELSLQVHCSKGTYIRTIVDDLGQVLSCGAHVKVLRRTSIASFVGLPMQTTESLRELALQNGCNEEEFSWLDEQLLPMDIQVQSLAEIELNDEQVKKFQHGMALNIATMSRTLTSGDSVRVYRSSECAQANDRQTRSFLGIATVVGSDILQPKRLVV
ncbi:tRNA pseudouridine(55) synthase TruB [Agaribacter flavus]|uniref:tRNA pseudouridine synthase B n=1 Tax=Agaribacter flavus TaxID=1902781 RepID=A0ABV7FJH9_9ALTE